MRRPRVCTTTELQPQRKYVSFHCHHYPRKPHTASLLSLTRLEVVPGFSRYGYEAFGSYFIIILAVVFGLTQILD